jgi:hypothetical protein
MERFYQAKRSAAMTSADVWEVGRGQNLFTDDEEYIVQKELGVRPEQLAEKYARGIKQFQTDQAIKWEREGDARLMNLQYQTIQFALVGGPTKVFGKAAQGLYLGFQWGSTAGEAYQACVRGTSEDCVNFGVPLVIGGLENVSIPRGFKSFGQFRQFGQALKAGFVRAGFRDVEAAVQGSSVTGFSFDTGEPLGPGGPKDFDIAISSPSLLDRARSLGIKFRGADPRTGPLTAEQIAQLNLTEVNARLNRMAGRPVNFMLFGSKADIAARGPSIRVPQNPR